MTSPLIIAHRGACGYLPEHTAAAYELAIAMGADFIEPDVVATRDGVLIVRHDPILGATTDVSARPEFAGRKRKIAFKGFEITDYFVADFTLAEIKTLHCRQAMAGRDHSHDGLYEIMTLQEVLDLRAAACRRTGRDIGAYPEIKYPSFHQSIGLAIEDKLVDMLTRAGLGEATSPVFIQSFEQANLKALKGRTDIRLMQLIDGSGVNPLTGEMTFRPPSNRPYDWTLSGRDGTYADLLTPHGLDDIAGYASVVAPHKRYLLSFRDDPVTDERIPLRRQDIVDQAHARDLSVHIWTMRDDAPHLDSHYAGDAVAEYLDFFSLGVDGVFSDFTDTAVRAREIFTAGQKREKPPEGGS